MSVIGIPTRIRWSSIPAAVALLLLLVVIPPDRAAASSSACAETLLSDWEDGRIDGAYSPGCYRKALGALPEDVRAYSTAQADIARGLRATIRREAPSRRLSAREASSASTDSVRVGGGLTANNSNTSRLPPLPVLLAAGVGLVIGFAGSASYIGGRIRVRRLAKQHSLR